MVRTALRQAIRHPATWILGVFAVLVLAEMYFWLADKSQLPSGITGSIFYPVILSVLSYAVVFRGTDHYRNFKALE